MTLSNTIFGFFKELKVNNNREWFLKNKPIFKKHEVQVKNFGEELKNRLNELIVLTGLNYLEYTETFDFPKTKHLLRHILDLLGIEQNLYTEEGIIYTYPQGKIS
jgi:uncharacterized protein (DUF2461 family)